MTPDPTSPSGVRLAPPPDPRDAEIARLRDALQAIADHGRMPGGSEVFNGAQHREAVLLAREALAHPR